MSLKRKKGIGKWRNEPKKEKKRKYKRRKSKMEKQLKKLRPIKMTKLPGENDPKKRKKRKRKVEEKKDGRINTSVFFSFSYLFLRKIGKIEYKINKK